MTNTDTIHFMFERHATRFPNHIAIISDSQSLSYGELNQRANQLAHYLQKLGLKPDTCVALCLERSINFLISLMAILKAGGAYLPLDPSQPQERLVHFLNDSQAPILITKSSLKEKLNSYQGTLVLLDKEDVYFNEETTDNPQSSGTSEHLAFIIYTSGSTGSPKGVLIEHRSVVNYCHWFADYSRCKMRQRIDFSGNPIFDMSVTSSIVPLMLGMTVVLCEEHIKKDIRHYLDYLAKLRINIIKLTPSYFKVLVQEAKNNFIDLPALECIVLGGENLSAVECQSWLAMYPTQTLFNEYGPTETTVAVSCYPVTKKNSAHLDTNIPIGRVGTPMSYALLDSSGQPVSEGEAGELLIGGICLARGYLNQPQLTEQQFVLRDTIRFYKTGDLCKLHSDGIIEFLGRVDEQVKVRGYRIDLTEIKQQLTGLPDMKEVAVLTQKDHFGEQRLVVYYIPKDKNTALHTNQIRESLQKHLPDYMIPSVFVKIDFFPLTENGKLDKTALPIPLLSSQNYIEPKTALEKKLAHIWSEELGVQLIGIYDHFFDLGGHSLSAARIISKINNELKREVSLQDFYKAPNIAQLAPIVKRTKKNKKKRARRHPGYYKMPHVPLSDFQFLLWMSRVFKPEAQKLNIVARKRFQGRLNKEILEFAFQAILRKHEAFIYQILKLQPVQKKQKNWSFKLIAHHYDTLSAQQMEHELHASVHQLINFSPWSKNTPLIIGKLCYLPNDESELQICVSHLISDDYCMDILFAELSSFYQHHQHVALDEIEVNSGFKEYIFIERHAMKMHLNRDMCFWEKYLQDSSLFAFPREQVVRNMVAENIPYSSYTLIPEQALIALKHFSEQNHLSLNHALCGAIALALRNCSGQYKNDVPYTYMNIIQSTRDNPVYDNTIGCFLRVEPIKILLDDAATLEKLSQKIRQSTIETSIYQHCSNLVKLFLTNSFKPNRLIHLFIRLFVPFYTKLFKIPSVYHKILQQYGSRMISFKQKEQFLINLNIRGNFFSAANKNKEFFGFNTKEIKINNHDLLTLDYIFEASFIRDDNQDDSFLVISANLKPDFRELIAQEVIRIMSFAA